MVATEPTVLATSLAAQGSVRGRRRRRCGGQRGDRHTAGCSYSEHRAQPAPRGPHGLEARSWVGSLRFSDGRRRSKWLAIGGDPVPTRKRPGAILPSRRRTRAIRPANTQVKRRRMPGGCAAASAAIGAAARVVALPRGTRDSTSCCDTVTLRNAGEKAEVRHPAVHDAVEQQPAQIPLGGLRGVAASSGAVGVPGVEPVGQSDRRRFRGRGLAVAARRVRDRGPLPRPGRLAAGAGRGAARGCLVRAT